MEKRRYIFGRLFLFHNKLQALGDHLLEDGVTIMQWLVTAAIAQFGMNYPTLSEVADIMGSSRQNIKELAVKLHNKGYICMEKDERDQRAVRLKLTEKSCSLWSRQKDKVRQFITELFSELSEEETDFLYESLNKLYKAYLLENGRV